MIGNSGVLSVGKFGSELGEKRVAIGRLFGHKGLVRVHDSRIISRLLSEGELIGGYNWLLR